MFPTWDDEGHEVAFSPRLIVQYKNGKIPRQILVDLLRANQLNVLTQIDMMGWLDTQRPEGISESFEMYCRCGSIGHIEADPYHEDVLADLMFDIYCETCYDEDCMEI